MGLSRPFTKLDTKLYVKVTPTLFNLWREKRTYHNIDEKGRG